MRTLVIGGALVMAAAVGCVAEVRTGHGAYTPPPPGPTPVYNNTPTQAAANTPPPAVTPAAGVATPTSAPAPAPSLANPANPHAPPTATVQPNGTTLSGLKYVPHVTNLFGNGPTGALKGTLYYIPDTTQSFPDVTKLPAQGTLYTNQLNVPMHDFEEGFPGVSNRTEWFAIRYTGTFNATKAGVYSFGLFSDDGANLYIDGNQVINNDGRHVPVEKDGQVNLTAGNHSIQVDYFKALRWVVALQLYCTPPGGQRVVWSQTM